MSRGSITRAGLREPSLGCEGQDGELRGSKRAFVAFVALAKVPRAPVPGTVVSAWVLVVSLPCLPLPSYTSLDTSQAALVADLLRQRPRLHDGAAGRTAE